MSAKLFSKKEAFAHGFKLTKKYFWIIFCIILIYSGFQIFSTVLRAKAGSPVDKSSVRVFYRDRAVADNFYKHLVETGYISQYGTVQEKLQNLSSAADLALPANLEADRDKIFNFLDGHRYRLPFPKVIFYIWAIALWVLLMTMQIGLIKAAILLARDQKPEISELFSNWRLFIKYLFGSICYGLAIMGGLILLIIPGIIFMAALGLYSYLIIDKNMGPIASLNASRALTKGCRWQLFLFWTLTMLLNLAGALCLLVGLLFTLPVTYIASAYVYDQLRKQKEAPVTPVEMK